MLAGFRLRNIGQVTFGVDAEAEEDMPQAAGPFGVPYPTVFVDGEFVDSSQAAISIHANVVSYGTGTFEGIRATYNPDRDQLYLMEPKAHYERLHRSANVLGWQVPLSPEHLTDVSVELVKRNGIRTNAYLRPLFVLAGAELTVKMHGISKQLSIAATPVIGDYVALDGLRCKVSSWRRSPDTVLPGRAKICGSYVTSALAKTEAINAGYDEALLMTAAGHIAEGTTANIFMRRGDSWVTPSVTDDILEGITRSQVMTLLAEHTGREVTERSIHRSELHVCDEVFLCGTAALVAPVVSVDDRPVGDGKPGSIGLQILQELRQIASGESDRHGDWVVPVYDSTKG